MRAISKIADAIRGHKKSIVFDQKITRIPALETRAHSTRSIRSIDLSASAKPAQEAVNSRPSPARPKVRREPYSVSSEIKIEARTASKPVVHSISVASLVAVSKKNAELPAAPKQDVNRSTLVDMRAAAGFLPQQARKRGILPTEGTSHTAVQDDSPILNKSMNVAARAAGSSPSKFASRTTVAE